MAVAGVLIVPAMWTFLLGPRAVLTFAPFTGILFLLSGVHMTYRSRGGCHRPRTVYPSR